MERKDIPAQDRVDLSGTVSETDLIRESVASYLRTVAEKLDSGHYFSESRDADLAQRELRLRNLLSDLGGEI